MTTSSASEVDQYDESEGDWSDFDPEAWSRGEDYPEHLLSRSVFTMTFGSCGPGLICKSCRSLK